MSDLQSPALCVPAETIVSEVRAPRASLTLGHVLTGIGTEYHPGVPLEDIHIIRHTFKPSDPDALRGPEDLTQERVLAYTREQDVPPRFPANPPRYWVILIADGGRRSRLWGTYENHGEVAPTSKKYRCFDLRPSAFLAPLNDRLVVEWDNPRSWHRSAGSTTSARMPVLEIANRDKVHFPGFDGVLLTYAQLRDMVDDPATPTGASPFQRYRESTSSQTPATANSTSVKPMVPNVSSAGGQHTLGTATAVTSPSASSPSRAQREKGQE